MARTRGYRGLSFKGWNWDKTGRDFGTELLSENCIGRVRKAVTKVFIESQQSFINSLPSEETSYMPFITGNLHDSIVSVISDRGRVIRALYPDPVAKEPSKLTGNEIYAPSRFAGKRVIGAVTARNAVRSKQGKYPQGLGSTFMVTVPYAENPNQLSERNKKGTHAGYLDVLASKYVNAMKPAFRANEKLGLFKWKGSWDLLQRHITSILNSED